MKFFKDKKNKKFRRQILSILFLCSFFVFLFSINVCWADGDFWSELTESDNIGIDESVYKGDPNNHWIANGMLIVINWLLYGIFLLCTYVFNAAKWLMDLMLDPEVYDKVFFSPVAISAIKSTWVVVRDFFNMFFMLIILLIAIGTILQVNRFSDKKMILNVILAAFLVNFSLPIALVMIDASNLAMSFFMGGVSQESHQFTNLIAEKIDLNEIWKGKFKDNLGHFVNLIFAIIFILVLSVMIALLAVSLLIRIIAYWVLLILSPLAMFGISLKGVGIGGEKMTSGWFQRMAYYSFFGPTLLFFLWIALHLIGVISESNLGSGTFDQFGSATPAVGVTDGITNISIGALKVLIPYIVAIYLLFYGFDVSKKFSSGATTKLMDWGSGKIKQWGKTAGKIGVGVGTLGAAPLAKSAYGAVSDYSQGFRNKDRKKYSPLKLLRTKEKKKEVKKENQERRRARGGGADEFNKYERRKVHELNKKWDETGEPSNEEQKKIRATGSSVEQKALATRMAKNGKLKTEDDFKWAMNTTGTGKKKDKVLEAKIRDNAKEKNVHAIMEYDIKRAETALNSGDERKIITESENNDVMKKELEAAEEVRKEVAATSGSTYTPMTDRERVDHLKGLNSENNFRQKVYDNQVQDMSIKSIQNQNPEFFGSDEAVNAIKDRYNSSSSNPDDKKAFKEAAGKNLSGSKLALLRNRGLLG